MTGIDRFADARSVADAVLYEGYVLYPYRASSNKNKMRWQFGVLAPASWAEADGSERWANRTEVLVDLAHAAAATLEVRIRFLQAQYRTVERALDPAGEEFEPVEQLMVDGAMYTAWDEAVEQEINVAGVDPRSLLGETREVELIVPAAAQQELLESGGVVLGRLLRVSEELHAVVRLAATPVVLDANGEAAGAERETLRLTVEVRNTSELADSAAPRDVALRRSLLAVHTLLGLEGARFVSCIDPPDALGAAAKTCRNDGTFPVLIGEEGSGDVVLSSPIILYDYPEIAPESPGDLYDGCEIDEILALRVLTLTEEEKAEARGTDARAAAIVDRCDDMPPELWERLHGAIRSIGPLDGPPIFPAPSVGEPAVATPPGSTSDPLAPWVPEGVGPGQPASFTNGDVPVFTTPRVPGTPGTSDVGSVPGAAPWWDPGADASVDPWNDTVMVDGIEVTKGTKVRLHPSHRADAHDLFVADQLATVAGVFHDVEEQMHVAVTIDDDPATDLFEWQGRFWFFHPDEVEPIVSVEPGR